jgi:hypothetical protein
MSTASTALAIDEPIGRSECWCCGCIEQPERMVHLGNHPEVSLCLRCAYWLRNKAREVEDQSKTGLAVRGRDAVRRARQRVIVRNLHRHPVFGPPLRWLGKHLP